ncbi:metal ABC transporter substrate-binding protein [Thiothrix nivea]|uniref:ABC-type metal ion transporter, periplasmic subunit n=1 Tax=Thiothrix nivea (strain ATCC 35100 / DSM 5205 / JP2) TaxID=870187 RepID=A0A656HDU6_THINJ|nr:metal ABC transporter substrate-binding protein [Thiothrix nivea]EIJ33610.1 ABC-type metal ion transporter, periplasmic subunit [Thiothrix nivea DSM 5205]
MLHQWLRRGLLVLLLAWLPSVHAEETPLKVVATFSVLGDMVRAVGGDRVQLTTLVGPDSDAHVYQPTPADAKTVAEADILFVNGFGFEGWLERLIEASGYKGKMVTVTEGITGLPLADADGHKEEHGHGDVDPHAWQSLAHAKTYVHNINRGLQAADPLNSAVYAINRDAYLQQLTELEQLITDTLDKLPESRRKVVTSHDAFGYFADAYRLTFLAPQGISTETEATAKDVAALIEQIRAEKITAVFLENMMSPRLLEQIAAESGAKVGGTLYADALSPADGEAGTYPKMMQHNIETLYQALKAE